MQANDMNRLLARSHAAERMKRLISLASHQFFTRFSADNPQLNERQLQAYRDNLEIETGLMLEEALIKLPGAIQAGCSATEIANMLGEGQGQPTTRLLSKLTEIQMGIASAVVEEMGAQAHKRGTRKALTTI